VGGGIKRPGSFLTEGWGGEGPEELVFCGIDTLGGGVLRKKDLLGEKTIRLIDN